MDAERLKRLGLIESAINAYYTSHQALPSNFDALDAEKNQLLHEYWHDPNTGQSFEYEIAGEKSYRLCANFERNSDGRAAYSFRKHNAGRDCFENQVKSK